MSLLRTSALLVYVAAWLVILCATLWYGRPRPGKAAISRNSSQVVATALQWLGLLVMAVSVDDRRPLAAPWAAVVVLVSMNAGAGLYVWVMRVGRHATGLVTSGTYKLVRHPLYLSMMLVLIGNLVLWPKLGIFVLSVGLYLCGTALRVQQEERALIAEHSAACREYREQTRWRLVPGFY